MCMYNYVAALYVNTAVSYKSNITKIYYCWPYISILYLFEKGISCVSDFLRILVCDMVAMPGKEVLRYMYF